MGATFRNLRLGDEVIICRQVHNLVGSKTTLVRAKVSLLVGQYLRARSYKFHRDTGKGVCRNGHGPWVWLVPRNEKTLRQLADAESQEAADRADREARAANENARRASAALAVARWLLAQTPEAVVEVIGEAALIDLKTHTLPGQGRLAESRPTN